MRTLPPCPDSPNCVSSQATDEKQRMPAMTFFTSREAAQNQLEAIVRGMPRASIVISEPGYFKAEFRSLIFRFVDDVEFVIDESNRVIQFRSASRTGYSDFGVNRTRMQDIAARFAAGNR